VKFRKRGDRVAVSLVRFDTSQAIVHLLTVSDLLTFPLYGIPIPDPEPLPMPTIPADVWAVVLDVHRRFASTLAADENGARDFMRLVIGQIVYLFPGQGWCWKKNGETAPASKDCLARQEGGRFYGTTDISSARKAAAAAKSMRHGPALEAGSSSLS
jgi:hypothetical protein